MTLIPAYGRDYTSKAKMLADWNADKDFLDALSGRAINRQDAIDAGIPSVSIRYKRMTMQVIVQVKP